MSKRSLHRVVAALGFVGFGVLMAQRAGPSSFAVRLLVAVLAGMCLGVALLYLGKARSSNPPKRADG